MASAVLLATAIAESESRAAILYVAPNGSDGATGTINSPLRTPARAVSLASAGDTIYLRAGTYTLTQTLVVGKNGVIISSYSGEAAALAGSTTDTTNLLNMLYVTGNDVQLIGLEIQGGSYYGVKIESNTGTVIRNCHIHDTGRDNIKMYLADNALFHSCDMGPTGVRDPSDAQCINAVACNGAQVRHCHFHDSANNGVYFKGGSSGCVVELNLVERCAYSGILLGQDTDLEFMRGGTQYEAINCVARNNIVVATGGAGLGTCSGSNVRFENNTLYDVARLYNAGLYVAWNSRSVPSQQVSFKNNIVVVASSRPVFYSIGLSDQLASDANLYFRPSGGSYGFWVENGATANYWTSITAWQSGTGADQHSIVGDPRLDSANLYRPLAGSQAIDHGLTLADVAVDYDGTARPQGAAYDIGAFEIPSIAPPQPPQPVQWTNLLGVTVSGTTVTKITESMWGNAGATSVQSIEAGDGYVEFTALETNEERMCGLSVNTANQGWADIAFAAHLNTGGAFYVVESGASRGYFGDYRSGDVFRVSVESGVVKYYRNGSVFFTSTLQPSYPLQAAAVFDGSGATISNAVISSGAQPAAALTVVAPAPAAVIKAGTTSAVIWSLGPIPGQAQVAPEATAGSVNIVLSTDGGATWTAVATGLAPSSGSYSWSVPMIKASNAIIQLNLTATDGATASATSGSFTIKKKRQ